MTDKETGHRDVSTRRPATAVAAPQGLTSSRLVVILSLMAVAFMASYSFASAQERGGQGAGAPQGVFQGAGGPAAGSGCGTSGGAGGAGGGAGCGGCGSGGGAPVEGATSVTGDVQTIAVDTSSGNFSPNVIKAKAGIPIEIAFSQAPGGCLAGVLFPDFGIQEDLTAGPKTVKLPALEAGTYTFFCQMQMISATLVVE